MDFILYKYIPHIVADNIESVTEVSGIVKEDNGECYLIVCTFVFSAWLTDTGDKSQVFEQLWRYQG